MRFYRNFREKTIKYIYNITKKGLVMASPPNKAFCKVISEKNGADC